jgi:hypothetical protein
MRDNKTMVQRMWRVAAPIALSAALVAACGGGGSDPTALRLTQQVNLEESGNVILGFNYIGNGGVDYSTPQWGVADRYLPAGADGSFQATLADTWEPGDFGPLLALDTTNAAVNYTAMDYAMFPDDRTSTYSVVTDGGDGRAGNGTLTVAAVGDVMRMSRVGTNILAEVSKDDGATWVVVQTWANAPATALYAPMQFANSAGLDEIGSSGAVQ